MTMAGPRSTMDMQRAPVPRMTSELTVGTVTEAEALSRIDSIHPPKKRSRMRNVAALDIPYSNSPPPLQKANSMPITVDTGLPSPPTTPPSRRVIDFQSPGFKAQECDSTFDLDIEHAQVIGSGLWSNVYKIQPCTFAPRLALQTPPATPQKSRPTFRPSVYAVKVASRPDAVKVFEHEARTLTYLQQSPEAYNHIIPFYGTGMSGRALVFEAATCGDLSTLINPSQTLPAILASFPSLARQLVSALSFLHSYGIIHADIKPGNILLDMDTEESASNPSHFRARFCDFSASVPIVPSDDSTTGSSPGTGGGTYTFMAPEQLTSNPCTNKPTTASDVWSLALTLLTYLLSGSPYAEYEAQGSGFMLREAIKTGDPLGFAGRSAEGAQRIRALRDSDEGSWALAALEGALIKRREERWGVNRWVGVVGESKDMFD